MGMEMVFHIEDDWIITRDVDVDENTIRILKKYNKLSYLLKVLNKRAMLNLDIVEGSYGNILNTIIFIYVQINHWF